MESKTTEQKVKDQIILKKNNIDLEKFLTKTTQENAIYKSASKKGNKFVYPDNLKDLSSRNRNKRNFRKQIQSNLKTFLSIDNPTKENKKSFQEFINTMFLNFFELDKCNDVRNIYNFESEAETKQATIILNKYKAIK